MTTRGEPATAATAGRRTVSIVRAVLAALLISCGLVGLAVGSFLNVVVHRVPRKESVVRPRSRCPECTTPIRERDNIPVVSWLLLRGRCRTCAAPISARYPLVELGTGLLFVATAARIGLSWSLPAYLVLVAGLVALSLIDLDTFLLPKKVVYPVLVAGIVLLGLAAVLEDDPRAAVDAAIGSVLAFAVLLVIHLVSPRGMGFGDVRLAAVIGLYLGWLELPLVGVGLFLAFLVASVVGVALMVAGRRGRKDAVPFGPFLAIGTLLALFVGTPILDLYLGR